MTPQRSQRSRAPLLIAGLLLLLVLASTALLVPRRPSGLVLATVPVGRYPSITAVDAKTGLAIVVNRGGPQFVLRTARGQSFLSLTPGLSIPANISVIDLRDGTLLRTLTIGSGLSMSGILIDERTHRAFVAGTGGRTGSVLVLDTTTGTLMGTTTLRGGAAVAGIDTVSGRVVEASYTAGIASVLDARSGRVVRVDAIDQGASRVLIDERTHRAFVESLPGGYGTRIPGTIAVIDTTSGALLRRVAVGLSPDGMAVAPVEGRVYVLNAQDGTVSVLDARGGAVLRTIALTAGGSPTGPGAIVVDERTHVAIIDHGWTHIVDTRTGRVLRVYRFSTVVGPLALDPRTDRAFAATYRDGRIRMLDAASGRLLRTIDVGATPQDVMVDEGRGRVYITTPGPVARAVGQVYARGPGRVWVLDARTGTVRARAVVGVDPMTVAVAPQAGRGVVLNMTELTSVSDPWAWMPIGLRRAVSFIPPPPPPIQAGEGSVSVLDLSR